MVLTVRVQGLPPTANCNLIRNFFTGLKIQPGGVHIIGGTRGEAFVTFMSKIYVGRALRMSGKCLLDRPINVSVKCHSLYNPGYVCITYRPLDATEADVKEFFKELSVESVLFFDTDKAIVKFEKFWHAEKVLTGFHKINPPNKMSKEQETLTVLHVKRSSEKMWYCAKIGPESKNGRCKRFPLNKNRKISASKWLPDMPVHQQDPVCIREYHAHLLNVSPKANKSHIRKFLQNRVGESQITFLHEKDGSRKVECFVMFITEDDYIQALMLDKALLLDRPVRVLPVTKETVIEMVENNRKDMLASPVSEEEHERNYFYLRNFAACASKLDVFNFFAGFSLTDKDVCMLYDDSGNSLGEALVKLSTKGKAFMAEQLNNKRFQDTEILVRRISREQLKAFGVDSFLDDCATTMDLCGPDVCVTEADDSPEATCDV